MVTAPSGTGKTTLLKALMAADPHLRFSILIFARQMEDADSRGAVLDSGVHIQPLRLHLFAGDDDVDEVARAQAAVGHAQQRVRIRWQIHANDVGLLVHHMVDKAGVLV